MFTGTPKDIITNIAAIVVVVAQAISTYLQANAGDINYIQLVLSIALALGLYLTGKSGDGSAKVV
jgi:hypothetical protein